MAVGLLTQQLGMLKPIPAIGKGKDVESQLHRLDDPFCSFFI